MFLVSTSSLRQPGPDCVRGHALLQEGAGATVATASHTHKESKMETTYGLFVHQDKVWQCETDDDHAEQRYAGPWPVLVWLTAEDHRDGRGWRRDHLEQLARVVNDHCTDVDLQAVLASVPSEEALVRLSDAFELWDGDEPPPKL